MTGKDLGWLFLWITLLVMMGMGTWSIRQRLLHHYSETDAAVRWLEWKTATEAMAVDIGPTSRTPVSTELPPSYILLRGPLDASRCVGKSCDPSKVIRWRWSFLVNRFPLRRQIPHQFHPQRRGDAGGKSQFLVRAVATGGATGNHLKSQ